MPTTGVADLMASAESEDIDLHSILLVKGGTVVAEAYREPFSVVTPHRMYSVTKSFTSTAVGLAVAEGLLKTDDPIVGIFPDLTPCPIDENLKALRVSHLLTMSTGHSPPLPPSGSRAAPSVAEFLAERLIVPPGARFEYSSLCSYVLAAAVQRVSGESIGAYLRPRLFEPLGIETRHWLQSDEGVAHGGWGLHLTTRELARFGQLYLQRGVWNGQRILSEAWIDEATGKRVPSWGNAGLPDWRAGYGYQFWRGRHDSYRADGLLGQFCVVLPKVDAVLVMTAASHRTQRILDLVWEFILPALSSGHRLEAEPIAFAQTQTGAGHSPRAQELAGVKFVLSEPFALPTRFFGGQAPIASLSASAGGDSITLDVTDRLGTYRLSAGSNRWSGGTTPLSTGYPEPYMGFGRWDDPGRLVVELAFTEAGFRVVLSFDLDSLRVDIKTPANPGLDGRVIMGRAFP